MNKEELLRKAYELFNARKADELLQLMTPDVRWPNGWEGGYVNGRDEVRLYWTRQWKEINSQVLPGSIRHISDDRVEVLVKQKVQDMQGYVLFDGFVKHVYSFHDHLISRMEIEAVE